MYRLKQTWHISALEKYLNYQIIIDPIDGWFISFPNFVVLHIHRLNIKTWRESILIKSNDVRRQRQMSTKWTMTIKLTKVFLPYLEVTSFMENPFAKFIHELFITWLLMSVIPQKKKKNNYQGFLCRNYFTIREKDIWAYGHCMLDIVQYSW